MSIQYIPPIKQNLKTNRPNVLLFGNGFFHSCLDWKELLKMCVEKKVSNSELEELLKTDYLLFGDAMIDSNDHIRQDKYISAINKSKMPEENICKLLHSLLELPFDAVITTNYTYQLEECLDCRFKPNPEKGHVYQIVDKLEEKTGKDKKGSKAGKEDTRFLMHTFNRISKNGKNIDIWHPHGELRRKSSLVLTHDEYGRFASELVKYNNKRKRIPNGEGGVTITSWFDYLLFGNVYILGFGASYTEFDFWWMLNRRKRETNRELIGNYYFYEPLSEANEAKKLLLSKMGVEYLNLDVVFTRKTKDYEAFYKKAIDDICEKLQEAQDEKNK